MVVIFFCVGLNIDRDKFLLSTSWCSSISELLFRSQFLFLANNNNSAPLFPLIRPFQGKSFVQRKWTQGHSCGGYSILRNGCCLLYWFSISKASLSFNYYYFSCWALFNGRPGWYSWLFNTYISLCLTYLCSVKKRA